MRTPASPASLRVARALLRQSQREVSKAVGVTQKTLGELEKGESTLIEWNLKLVDFYETNGIEFLGDAHVGKLIDNAGARWSAPDRPDAAPEIKAKFPAENHPVNFGAARALIRKSQADVASSLDLSKSTIQQLEGSAIGMSAPAFEKLKHWYEEQGVVFTGWGDVSTGLFYGVGVQLASK